MGKDGYPVTLPGMRLANDLEAATVEIPKGSAVVLHSEFGVEGVYTRNGPLMVKLGELRKMGAYRTAEFSTQVVVLDD